MRVGSESAPTFSKENPEFNYDEDTIIFIIVSGVGAALGILLLIIKILQFCTTSFDKIRVDILYATFAGQIAVGLVVICHALMYEIGDVITIIVDVFLSIGLWFFYVYVKEGITYFTHSYLTKNPDIKSALIRKKEHDEAMFTHDPPMPELKHCARHGVTNLFVEYTYYLSGEATVGFCKKKRISSYQEAHSHHWRNNFSMIFYLFIITIFFSAEVVIDRTKGVENVKIGPIDFGKITKILSLVATIMFIPRINSFATTFHEIYPWFDAKKQLTGVIFMKLTKTLSTTIVGFFTFNIGKNSNHDSKQLVICALYSVLYLLLVIIGHFNFNAKIIKDYEIKLYEAHVKDDLKQSLVTGLNDETSGVMF